MKQYESESSVKSEEDVLFSPQLFLGFALDPPLILALDQLPDAERKVFIQNESSAYLQQIFHKSTVYLGKSLGLSLDISRLDTYAAHVSSLLKKLFPAHSHFEPSLVVIAIPLKN